MGNKYLECPCCGYYSVNGHGDICQVCYWEYDLETECKGETVSIMNGMTLNQAKDNFIQHGAVEIHLIEYVLPYEARSQFKVSVEGKRLQYLTTKFTK